LNTLPDLIAKITFVNNHGATSKTILLLSIPHQIASMMIRKKQLGDIKK